MKRLICIFALVFGACLMVSAQQADKDVIYKTVPQEWKLKDRIIVLNKSTYVIEQLVVALPEKGRLVPLGVLKDLRTAEPTELASFADNGLKQLRGKQIAIKVKGIKGGNPTYDFDVKMYEEDHDLYIEVLYAGKENNDIMNF